MSITDKNGTEGEAMNWIKKKLRDIAQEKGAPELSSKFEAAVQAGGSITRKMPHQSCQDIYGREGA